MSSPQGSYNYDTIDPALLDLSSYPENPSADTQGHPPAETILYEFKQIGKGLIAKSDIPRGTRIFADPPVLVLEKDCRNVEASEYCYGVVCNLLDSNKEILLYLNGWVRPFVVQNWRMIINTNHNDLSTSNYDKEKLMTAIAFNGFILDTRQERRGVFCLASNLNHSCIPNAAARYNARLGMLTVHALRHINAGEEIEIDYTHNSAHHLTRSARQAYYAEHFGFTCACGVCGDPVIGADSDARRVQLQTTATQSPENWLNSSQTLGGLTMQNRLLIPPSPEAVPQMKAAIEQRVQEQEDRVRLLYEEGLVDERLGEALHNLAKVYRVARNRTKTEECGNRAIDVLRCCVGEDHPKYIGFSDLIRHLIADTNQLCDLADNRQQYG